MPSTIVELAKILCPSPAHLAKRVALALEDPAAYVEKFRAELALRGVDEPVGHLPVLALIDGLIAGKLATELDWREDPTTAVNHPLVTNPIGQAFLDRPASTFDATKDPLFKALVAALKKEALLPARQDPFRA